MKSNFDVHTELADYDFSDVAIAIVQSKYHNDITDVLYQGAVDVLKYYKVGEIYHRTTAGAFELIFGATDLVYDEELMLEGVITLGCVIKGDTDHDQYINQAVTDAIAKLTIDSFTPVSLGLLTVNTREQAIERAGGIHGNKGKEAALALLHCIASETNLVV
jgi:6,7-dimethyl-8-ribityllumazine synthase